MWLIDFIFGKPIVVKHDLLGEMKFDGNLKKPQDTDYFECKYKFRNSKDDVIIHIYGNSIGIGQSEMDFFLNIEKNYHLIINSIVILIEDEFRNWKEDFKIINFEKEFIPIYINIPKCDAEMIKWEIAFKSEHDWNHDFTLTMNNFEAEQILIDG